MKEKQEEMMDIEDEDYKNSDSLCPCCNYPLAYENHLPVCYNCGWFEGCEKL